MEKRAFSRNEMLWGREYPFLFISLQCTYPIESAELDSVNSKCFKQKSVAISYLRYELTLSS